MTYTAFGRKVQLRKVEPGAAARFIPRRARNDAGISNRSLGLLCEDFHLDPFGNGRALALVVFILDFDAKIFAQIGELPALIGCFELAFVQPDVRAIGDFYGVGSGGISHSYGLIGNVDSGDFSNVGDLSRQAWGLPDGDEDLRGFLPMDQGHAPQQSEGGNGYSKMPRHGAILHY